MSNLLWKEWHEQSWKLAFGCLVLGAMSLIGLHSRIVADESMMMCVCFVGLTLLPVLSSTGLVPAERSDGSFDSLIALPVAPWRILAAKTVMGLVLCAGPLLAAATATIVATGGREISNIAAISLYMRTTLATVSLYIWMTALTARLPNEARAALLALGVFIFWLLATAGLAEPPIPSVFFAVSPLAFVYGFANGFSTAPALVLVLIVQAATISLLWLWTSRRFVDATEDQQ